MPMWQKYLYVVFFSLTWKWSYYAPNTFKVLCREEMQREGKEVVDGKGKAVPQEWHSDPWTIFAVFSSDTRGAFFSASTFMIKVLGPYLVARFVVLPTALGLCLGSQAFINAAVSLVLADLLTNAHSFLVIVTNHAGDDHYRFERHCKPLSATFYLRQVISSVNFATGSDYQSQNLGDLNDFMHGWLNYQIEHHLWPNLSMLSYQKAQPLVKALCKQHGIPYMQHSVWWRLHKTIEIMTGATSMRKFPVAYESEVDLMGPATATDE